MFVPEKTALNKKQQHHESINLNLLKIFAQNLILIKGYNVLVAGHKEL